MGPKRKPKAQREEARKRRLEKERERQRRRRQNSVLRAAEQRRNTEYRRAARQNKEYRKRERERDRKARRKARENKEYRRREQERDLKARRKARENKEYRRREQERDLKARKAARENKEQRKKEQERDKQAHRTVRENKGYRKKQERNHLANSVLRIYSGVILKMKTRRKVTQKDTSSCSEDSLNKVSPKSKVAMKSKKQAAIKRQTKTNSDTQLASSSNDEVKVNIPVDSECIEKVGKAHVYCEGGDLYNATLNQTNVQFNNNKYYLLQLLKDNTGDTYSVWFRWGRVGKKGQTHLQEFGNNLKSAKDCFEKKFNEKTKNKWEERNKFCKVEGKYDLVSIEYDDDKILASVAKSSSKSTNKIETAKSKLKKQVQDLMKLILNIKLMENTAAEMKYDVKKVPLGNLTTEQIKAGYLTLKKIEKLILENNTSADLVKACNEFYTRIPHDFGMKRPPIIRTLLELKEKIDLLEVLGGIEIAMNLMTADTYKNIHPIDYQYGMLSCELEPLAASHPDYKLITQYVQNTHGYTHRHYTLRIANLFKCCKPEEEDNFCDYGNRMLLWHGSRLSNWAGILKNGLKIAPPEAPCTGYMFGKGIYFADMVSKSANYCYAVDEGLLVLCEVSVGNQNEMRYADYNANKLPKDKQSVFAKGRTQPNPNEAIFLSDGVKVPLGKAVTDDSGDYSLLYNEYIVYNRNQVKMRYLVHVNFDH